MNVSKWVALGAASFSLAGCGGGGAGLGGSPAAGNGPSGGNEVSTVAVGRIDAFGSVFVNGVEFETNKSTFNVRGENPADQSSLSVGMVVRVKGVHDSNGHGEAHEIRYDAEIEGLVADVTSGNPTSKAVSNATEDATKHFTVFGQEVIATATTVFKGVHGTAYSLGALANGDHVEVSGDYADGVLIATFIERKDPTDTVYEVRGTISSSSGSTFVLTLKGGRLLNVTLADGVALPAGVADGSLVELHGTIPDVLKSMDFLASLVEVEDDDDFDGHGRDEHEEHADLGGVLALDGTTWSVRGTTLKFSASTQYRPATLAAAVTDGSATGLRVHVRGAIVGGVLNVDSIRADGRANGDGDLDLAGLVSAVKTDAAAGTTTITMSFKPATGTIDVVVDAQTRLMNDKHSGGLDLTSLQPDVSFAEVRGHLDSTGAFVAGALHVEDQAGGYVVSGPVDTGGFVAGVSISVLGVKLSIDAGTELAGGAPADQAVVEIRDADSDGFADLVRLGDHGAAADFARPDHSI